MARAGDVFPARNLPGRAENWGRHVQDRIELGEESEVQLAQKVNNGLRATAGQLAVISENIDSLVSQQADLVQAQQDLLDQQAQLVDAAQYSLDSYFPTQTGATGWVTNRPSITKSSLSGRFAITISGIVSWGMGTFTFSTTGYDRTRALGGGAAIGEGVTISAPGATISSQAFRTWVISLTPATSYTFLGEAYAYDANTAIAGLQISVQPML